MVSDGIVWKLYYYLTLWCLLLRLFPLLTSCLMMWTYLTPRERRTCCQPPHIVTKAQWINIFLAINMELQKSFFFISKNAIRLNTHISITGIFLLSAFITEIEKLCHHKSEQIPWLTKNWLTWHKTAALMLWEIKQENEREREKRKKKKSKQQISLIVWRLTYLKVTF